MALLSCNVFIFPTMHAGLCIFLLHKYHFCITVHTDQLIISEQHLWCNHHGHLVARIKYGPLGHQKGFMQHKTDKLVFDLCGLQTDHYTGTSWKALYIFLSNGSPVLIIVDKVYLFKSMLEKMCKVTGIIFYADFINNQRAIKMERFSLI